LRFVMPALHIMYKPYLALRPPGSTSLLASLGSLAGRNVLLIAASEPLARYEEEKTLYAALPESLEGGKNLLELKASGVTGVYAEDKRKYDQAIVKFFSTCLGLGTGPSTGRQKSIEVLER